MTNGMVLEKHFFKIVVDQLRRTIVVRLNLVHNNHHFLVNFLLRKSRMQRYVRYQLHGTFEILVQHRGINNGFLLRSKSIQLPSHILQPIDNMTRTAFFGSFKKHVLDKVCHALLRIRLVARSGINHQATIGHGRSIRFMN